MKSKTKFLAFVGCVVVNFLMVTPLAAQNYVYGVTEQSENSMLGGNIYRFTPQGKISETVATMPIENKGSHPVSSMVKHSNGFYYGTTGDYAGLIYQFDLATNQYTIINEFDANDYVNGWGVSGGVIEGNDGKLYGMTTYGGSDESGLIYSYDLNSNSYSVLHEFNTNDDEGAYPKGKLLEFSPGIFYGMTEFGGLYSSGQLFKYDLPNDTYVALNHFNTNNGTRPTGTLQKRGADKLVGTTKYGGAYGNGLLFEYNIASPSYTKLASFNNFVSGNRPNDPLLASDGNIYGTTEAGGNSSGGVFYKYDFSAGLIQVEVLHNFDSDNTLGAQPFGSLVESSGGKIYGTTEKANDGFYQFDGNIFEFDPVAESISNVYSFDGKNSKGPKAGLTLASSGDFLGTTYEGGASGLGTIFMYSINQDVFNKLVDFSLAPIGSSPKGGLTVTPATNSLVYGITYNGGPKENSGTIFSFDPTTSELALVHDFAYEEGGHPVGGLALSADSVLYGVTSEGGNLSGSLALGTLYSFDLKTGVYTQLYNLPLSNGDKSKLILLNNKLYGTVNDGGQYNKGMIYEYDITYGIFSLIYEFDTDGYLPVGHPTVGSDGKLYGTTRAGGANNYGVIYSLDLSSNSYSVEHDFVLGLSGGTSSGALIEGDNGVFFGLTENGGDNYGGLLYQFTVATGSVTPLHEFADGIAAYFPVGELTLTADGMLFGQTAQQSSASPAIGAIFSYNLNSSSYSLVSNFPGDIPNEVLSTYCLYPVYDVVGATQFNLCTGEDLAISISTSNTDSFVWKKDGVVVAGATANIFFKSMVAASDGGTYTFELTNVCGTITGEVNVFVSDIGATFTNNDILCFGEETGVISIDAFGGVPGYEFSLDGINFQTTDFTELAAGTYDITIRDANNCSIEIQQTLSQPAAALSASFTSSAVDCNGNNTGGIEVGAIGGVEPYEYSIDGENFVSFALFGSLPAGAYPVTVTDANGCSVTETVEVTEPNALSVELVVQQISCIGLANGGLSATVQGGTEPYQYSIDGTNFQSDVLFGQLAAGDYTITVKDANSCTASADASIIEPEVFTVSASVTNASCHGTGSGSISIAVIGPDAAAYTYSIDGEAFQDTPTFGSLVSGSYTISVKSATGCIVETDATVTQPDQLLASTTVVNTTCGENNGSVSISAAGGSGTYSYSLDGADFVADASFAGLASGDHTVQVKDEVGCVTNVAFTVAASTGIALTLTEAEGLVTATAEGGTAPYQFSINGAEFQEGNVFNLAPGDYSISAQDANGCGAGQEITIEVETGIGDQFLQNEMLAYPNPSSQSISFNATTIKIVRLFDLSGNKVLTVNNYRTRESIDLSHLVPGVVIVELELSTGKRIKQRLIIER